MSFDTSQCVLNLKAATKLGAQLASGQSPVSQSSQVVEPCSSREVVESALLIVCLRHYLFHFIRVQVR